MELGQGELHLQRRARLLFDVLLEHLSAFVVLLLTVQQRRSHQAGKLRCSVLLLELGKHLGTLVNLVHVEQEQAAVERKRTALADSELALDLLRHGRLGLLGRVEQVSVLFQCNDVVGSDSGNGSIRWLVLENLFVQLECLLAGTKARLDVGALHTIDRQLVLDLLIVIVLQARFTQLFGNGELLEGSFEVSTLNKGATRIETQIC
mmetsp:Transcript_21173/g.49674  ORF Transcript_21173/g.49674 Transcript_21173/m.49674 type:complete len:206 (+) Transcript_21173:775-1392(+)